MFSLLLNIAEKSNVQVINTIAIISLLSITLLTVIIFGIYFYDPTWFSRRISIIKAFRSRIFVHKAMGNNELQKAVKESGYNYDWKQDIFYSLMNPWQREYGYCRTFDDLCPPFGMIIDSEPIYFYYGGKNWLIEFWKGQYDLTTGCEVGIYTKQGLKLDQPNTAVYNSASNTDRLFISYSLIRKRKTLFKREDKHWWLTGFMLGEFSNPSDLIMEIKITFKNETMRNSFEEGLKNTGYKKNEYHITGNTVSILFTKPHSRQPITRTSVTDRITQEKNYLLCKGFVEITSSEDDMGGRIKAVEENAPELLDHIVNIGKSRQFFEKTKEN
jgi:hypothetical protein